ncbi:starvation-inducible protein [Photobacterium sanctipauli]|uniref:Starvation-inducible protein n=1 Tax=Photobacterium sanctipauli TaxID=1342794 RepID=A0A2T3NR47_9GAMM|nr:Slp family lipoprotein [Photobacterium sanctipauli]PSW18744.1 starvation-inducible protein [Photobacterium sanctipauli]
MFRTLFLGLVTAFMVGCASLPPSLQTTTDTPITDVAVIAADPEKQVGNEVLLGGVIAGINNEAARTRLEIVALPIGGDGKPKLSAKPQHRYVAYVDGFLEPLEYNKGKLITVVGRVSGQEQGSIGEYEYQFPVIKASGNQLWKVKQEIWLDDFDRFHHCIGTRCSMKSIGYGPTRGEVWERVTL